MAVNTNKYGTFRQNGIPVKPSRHSIAGDTWFVDGENSVTGNGKTPAHAFLTIAEGIAAASAYDTIYVRPAGNSVYNTSDYTEDVTIPYTKPGISLIGCGNGRMEGVLWTTAAANGTILTIKSRDCRIEGFRFRPNGATGWAVRLYKWIGPVASAALTDSSGVTFFECAFRSTGTTSNAIWVADGGYNEGANDMTVEECTFDSCIYALYCNLPATIPSRTIFKNVRIANCTYGISHQCRRSKFERVFISDLAGGMMLDTDNTGNTVAALNTVHHCSFGDANSEIEEVNAGTTDSWTQSFFGAPEDSPANTSNEGLFILLPDGAVGT